MTSVAIFAAVAALGVHWGWQPAAGGGIEYIIRIDPYSVDSMKEGHDVFSDLPPTLPAIRSYRVTVSDKPVPHEGEPPPRSQSVMAARPPGESTSQPTLASDEPRTAESGSRLFPPPKASAVPAVVPQNRPAAEPTAQHAAATAQQSAPASASPSSSAGEPSRSWPALTGTLIMLFASLAGNAWLVWVALEFRKKYLAQIARLKPAG